MAQDIGLLLRGLGAAVSNQVPQFRQQMAQEQEAQMRQQEFQAQQEQRMRQGEMQNMEMMQARQQATFQDADAALRLAATGNYEAIIALAEDRMQLDQRLGGPLKGDNTAMLANMARRAAMGDAQAASQLNLQLAGVVEQGLARGILQRPEAQEKVYRPGDVVYRNGEQAFAIPSAPAAQPATFRLLTAAEVQQQGLEPGNYQLNERTKQVSRIGAPSTVVNVGQATESERTAGILANRLDFAQGQIKDILTSAPEAEKPAVGATALNTLGLEYLARVANPAERQIIEAAQMDMLDAALTLGTGAAYTREQLEGYRTSYFPQLGDDPRTINAKSQRLNNLVSAAYEKAGRAAPTERRGAESQAPQDWIASGLDQSDWNALSEDDKKAYLESN
jgi:hypothetical protein